MDKREVIAEILNCADVLDTMDNFELADDLTKVAQRLAQYPDYDGFPEDKGYKGYKEMREDLDDYIEDTEDPDSEEESVEDLIDPDGMGLNPDVFGPGDVAPPAEDNHLEEQYELQTELPEY